MESPKQNVISGDRLLSIIAKKTVEIDLLEEQIARLQKQIADMQPAAKPKGKE